jgi:hypothetical protein
MFDIVITSAPSTPFATRVASVLRAAHMRVVPCEISPQRPPPDALRVDAAVACAIGYPAMLAIARAVHASLDGPPPIVGISGQLPASPSSELAQALPDDVSDAALVAHVQRVAAHAERRRSKVVLQGDLDDVGLEHLLASLASRNRSCFVRVRAGNRRAEITLEGGAPLHVRVDGVDPARGKSAALAELGALRGATFEVIAGPDTSPPRSRPPPSLPAALPSSSAANVALAAAIINAYAAYAAAYVGPARAGAYLVEAHGIARAQHPALDAFQVSPEGGVAVTQVDRALLAVPSGLAAWTVAYFDVIARTKPARFHQVSVREVLGGLTHLVEQSAGRRRCSRRSRENKHEPHVGPLGQRGPRRPDRQPRAPAHAHGRGRRRAALRLHHPRRRGHDPALQPPRSGPRAHHELQKRA